MVSKKKGLTLSVSDQPIEDQMDIDDVLDISPEDVEAFAANSETAVEKKRSSEARQEKEKDSAAKPKPSASKKQVKRDNFTFPMEDYKLIAEMQTKIASLSNGEVMLNKSEVVRLGLHALASLYPHEIEARLKSIEKLHGKNR